MSLDFDIRSFKPDWYNSATIQDQQKFRHYVNTLLKRGEIVISYSRKDGLVRTVNGRKESPNCDIFVQTDVHVLSIWDPLLEEWRHIPYNSIVTVEGRS